MFIAGPSDVSPATDPWAWQAHPEVWLLVASLAAAYVYMAKVIGPRAVPAGERPVTGRQWGCFVGALGLFWFAADWPMHDIGEGYLYSVHMFQHMVFAYFVPPLGLMAIPPWMARAVIGDGRAYRTLRFLAKPVIAGVIVNLIVMILHIPAMVNTSASNGALHYSLHLAVVLSSLLMWTPVVGPIKEFQIGPGAKMIYLFLMSVIPTIPAGWLTFAEGTVYDTYNTPIRVWGLSVTEDQQIAGAVMKLGGSMFLWSIIIYLFFKKFGAGFETENTYVRNRRVPTQEITGNDETTLTFDEVHDAFARSTPPVEGDTTAPR
jgi:putative membrane protein